MKAYFMKMKSLAVALAGILIMGTLWGCGNTQSAKAVPESGESLTASTAENDENGSSADSSSRKQQEKRKLLIIRTGMTSGKSIFYCWILPREQLRK